MAKTCRGCNPGAMLIYEFNARLLHGSCAFVGAWLSLARAPGSGPGGRWFKSTRPDHLKPSH